MALTPFFGRDPFWGTAGPLMTTGPSLFDEFSRLIDAPLAGVLDAPVSEFARDTRAIANTAVDVKETSDAVVFTADMPGLRKEEVKVQVEDGNVLCISGERQREKTEDTDRYHRVERSMGRFQRRFRLPDYCDADKIKAAAEHGVLTVSVPKKEQQPPQQQRAAKDVPIQ